MLPACAPRSVGLVWDATRVSSLREECARRAHLRLALGERLDHGAALQHLLHVLNALRHLLQPALHVLHREDQVHNLRVNTQQRAPIKLSRKKQKNIPFSKDPDE